MMGHRQVEPAAAFYEFSLESHVPANHPLGYCFDIRSERRLCEDVHLNPAYRYLIDADNAIIAHLGLQARSRGMLYLPICWSAVIQFST
jgi:hypothetical protein